MIFQTKDNLLSEHRRKEVYDFLMAPGWAFGWKSNREADKLGFWHKHFAGYKTGGDEAAYECSAELKKNAPLMFGFWEFLSGMLRGHRLIRCYANGLTYGSDGMVHVDAKLPNSFTCIYYPHELWSPNWGGETVFFDREETDVIAVSYPKPNRMIMFPGRVPHAARGVSRICPRMRITLMFKTDVPNGGAPV